MIRFQISSNKYLSTSTNAFYHVPYTRFGNPDNPNYLNDLKNTFNNFSEHKLQSAARELMAVLQEDLPQIFQSLGFNELTACVIPRAKEENDYQPNQQLFRATVKAAIAQIEGFIDGTNYIRRHTTTRTTHLRNPVPNFTNDGPLPYPGITSDTCSISPNISNGNILLIDDIYTPNVNIDEDAINALLNAGAQTVTFYAVGKTLRG